MTLLNAMLALGALAFTVPLAIHLLFRSRFRTVDWGAMHLLENVIRINRRRIQLLHLLLLLLRCLLPVLLAFCLARPVLTGFKSLPGDAPQSLVLAIDDSRSMAARDASGASRIDRARQSLVELLSRLSRRDEVILLPSSSVDSPPARMGAQDAISRVRQLRAQAGPVDLGRLIRAAVEAADDGSHQQRRIIVVSDFQSSTVNDAAMQALGRLSTQLADKPLRPVVSFLNFGVDTAQLSNVAVESIAVDSPAIVAGRGTRFSARLRNASDTPMRDLRLVWSIDGNPLNPRTISISPRSTVMSRLSRRIDVAGAHEITVSVEHGDALVEDNQRSIAVDVIRQINVLLVDGKPSNRPLDGETDFLAIALSPFAFGGEDQPDAVRTTVVKNQRLEKAIADRQPHIVVLANVDRVSDKARSAIATFVNGGGALVIFDGDAMNTDSYNQPWVAESGSWTLPAALDRFVGTTASPEATPLPIGETNAQFSPWDVLGARDQQPFGKVSIFGYRKLIIREQDAVDQPGQSSSDGETSPGNSAAVRLLSMGNGDPVVLMARRGRGRVVQFAVPCDAAWTTLPMRLVYLPMMQQLVLELAGSGKQMTYDVGNSFSVPASELAVELSDGQKVDDKQRPTFTLEVPGQSEVAIQPTEENSPQLMVDSAQAPGTYRLRQTTPILSGDPIVTDTLRVVEVPAIESQLRDADSSRLAAAAEAVDANVYTDIGTLQADDRTRRNGREIWRWLLFALLIAMIAELFLQQRSIRRTSIVGAS